MGGGLSNLVKDERRLGGGGRGGGEGGGGGGGGGGGEEEYPNLNVSSSSLNSHACKKRGKIRKFIKESADAAIKKKIMLGKKS